MIYVSSSCVKGSTIKESVTNLVELGYKNIELSGGTQPYEGLERDLLLLQDKFDIHYLCHNYFPPPTKDFVLNIASLDQEVSELSMNHIEKALELSAKLGAKKFAFHAGFRINIPLNEIGKRIEQQSLFDDQKCRDRFRANLDQILTKTENVDLYVENNVLSAANHKSFNQENPFFLTDQSDLSLLNGIKPLIDVAHLKVSCHSLGLNFRDEVRSFFNLTDYVHISDNDGKSDQNMGMKKDGALYQELKQLSWANKTITLEVYSGPKDLEITYQNTLNLIGESKE